MFHRNHSPLSPSDDLVSRLSEYELCRPADLQRAKKFARRLAYDLPAFDSVWIDALVQLRRLTPYQARMLEDGRASSLRIGSYVIIDQLARSPWTVTYRAKSLEGNRGAQYAIKRCQLLTDDAEESCCRMREFIERTGGWSHPHMIVPQKMLPSAEAELAIASVFVPGIPLNELLVRRGRFPAAVVFEIARQLLDGLASLDRLGLVHGDIRLSNVRLTERGLAILVDGGIRPCVCPELTIHASHVMESYDGIAPELIGTGAHAHAGSDLYALGCLLWQLLSGRPPHPVADPLRKLAAHQSRRIEDVRHWAPDTPDRIAQALFKMTSPAPAERPRSFGELLQAWGRPGALARSRLKQYRRSFDGAIPHLTESKRSSKVVRWPRIAAAVCGVVGLVFTMANHGLRNDLLALKNRIVDMAKSVEAKTDLLSEIDGTATGKARTNERGKVLLPLPRASPDGEILLTEVGPYGTDEFPPDGSALPTSLSIRGAMGVRPVIQIRQTPLKLAAETVALSNVAIRCESFSGEPTPTALVIVRSRRLTLEGCELDWKSVGEMTPGHVPYATLAWMPQDTTRSESDQTQAGQIEVQNTLFFGSLTAMLFTDSPSRVTLTNCLKVGEGTCMNFGHKATARPIAFELSRVTLRNTGPLIRYGGALADAAAPGIGIVVQDCVFALASATSSLIEIRTAHPETRFSRAVSITGRAAVHGQISLIRQGLELLSVTHPQGGETSPVPETDEQFEGLIQSDGVIEFIGEPTGSAENSQLKHLAAPRSTVDATLPGIDPTRMPHFRHD